MNKVALKEQLSSLALSMFRKDFFGIYHGSISSKTDSSRFIINSKDAVFDNLNSKTLIELNYKRDYRWNDASIDSNIHLGIYKNFSDAKFITFTMPQFTTAYSINHTVVIPQDYFGDKFIGTIPIYDIKQFDDWYDRASSEIPHYFLTHKTNIMIIRGYGVYIYDRDIHVMAKKLAILEKSCRMLMLNSSSEESKFI
ncbi:MAG: class II aldolase and adducin N-terminal domain-containing protein [Campylobacterota bacterium]|nr:class II aldolase and adducin N-terminal domain-containing protein [Campylobacterota bacterium]